jgi:phosphoglycolate phosphatase
MPSTLDQASVLFDLDGTFADTAPDLAFALNQLLKSEGRPPLPLALIRPHASHGGNALLKLGFGLVPGEPGFAELRETYLAIYRDHVAQDTRMFPGFAELLAALESRAVPWGIVTNKPAWLTEPLVRALGVWDRAGCVVSGDTTPHLKPHPEPVRHACRLLGRSTQSCWYLGDAERDVEAGRSAGTRTLVALFGYLGDQDQPETWGADGLIEHPLDLLDWLDS